MWPQVNAVTFAVDLKCRALGGGSVHATQQFRRLVIPEGGCLSVDFRWNPANTSALRGVISLVQVCEGGIRIPWMPM
jgi:hypothetical protein